MAKSVPKFTLAAFFVRWVGCVLFMLAIANSSGHSYVDWVLSGRDAIVAKLGVGVILAVIYIAIFRIATTSLGRTGVLSVQLVLLLWQPAAIQLGLLTDPLFGLDITMVEHATVLAVGMNWSHFSYRTTTIIHVLKAPP